MVHLNRQRSLTITRDAARQRLARWPPAPTLKAAPALKAGRLRGVFVHQPGDQVLCYGERRRGCGGRCVPDRHDRAQEMDLEVVHQRAISCHRLRPHTGGTTHHIVGPQAWYIPAGGGHKEMFRKGCSQFATAGPPMMAAQLRRKPGHAIVSRKSVRFSLPQLYPSRAKAKTAFGPMSTPPSTRRVK